MEDHLADVGVVRKSTCVDVTNLRRFANTIRSGLEYEPDLDMNLIRTQQIWT